MSEFGHPEQFATDERDDHFAELWERRETVREALKTWEKCRCKCPACRSVERELALVAAPPHQPTEQTWDAFEAWMIDCHCGCDHCGVISRTVQAVCGRELPPIENPNSGEIWF